METRICTKCNRELPTTTEFFYRQKKGKYGLTSFCRECLGSKFKKQPKEGFIICSKCKKELPANLEFFYKHIGGKHGLSSMCKQCERLKCKKYRQNNQDKILVYRESIKEHKKELDKAYYKANKEKITEYKKEYRKKNIKKLQKKSKRYYEKNKEKIMAKNRIYEAKNIEKVRKWKKNWRDNNPEKIAVIVERRRADKFNTENSLTPEQWKQCLEFFNYKDAYTGLPMETISQDHVIPLSKNGAYTRENIIPCELSVNCSKQDSDMEEWFRKQSYFSEERLNKIYKWIDLKDKEGD